MNTPMLPEDDDIQAFLSADSELMQRYRALPQSEPGKHLDAAILGRAGNAVRRPAPRSRWLIPLASAASLVAAAGIGWRVHLAQQQEQASAMRADSAYDVTEIDLQGGASSERARALETAAMPPAVAAPVAADGAAASAKAMPASPAQRPSLSDIVEGPARDNGVVVDEPHTRSDHAMPGRAPEQSQTIEGYSGQAEATMSRSAPQPAAAPAPYDQQESMVIAPDRRARNEGVLTRREQREQREAEREAKRDADRQVRQANDNEQLLAPSDWIRSIRVLINQRRDNEARRELARFQQAYPSYRLPPDLRRFDR